MKSLTIKIIFLLSAVILTLTIRSLWHVGFFSKIEVKQPFDEIRINGLVGAEDITIDQKNGLAFVSSCDRRSITAGLEVKGAIYLFNVKNLDRIINLTESFDQDDFRPHGISLFHDTADSTIWLHVINHRKSGHYVEIFQYIDTTLHHMKSIKSSLLISPNDIVSIGRDQFYFTNDHDDKPNFFRTLKDFLLIGTGSVGYFDGKIAKILDKGIRYANGITIDQANKKLYVAACTDKRINVYNIDPFMMIDKIPCHTGVDNLEWDSEGNLWVGAHPKLLNFLSHAKDSLKLSPSQVLKIDVKSSPLPIVETIYLNDGKSLSGSSVAAVYQNQIILGSVFEDHILILKSIK